jgi:hypothetical protein
LLTWLGTLFTQFGAEVSHPQFWVNLSKIIWINILLSGDNALVVAMACRSLEPRQRFWGMILGTAAAVLLRIIFTVIIASVMGLPYLKLVGGLALLVIAAKLLVPQEEEAHSVGDASHLWAAVQIVWAGAALLGWIAGEVIATDPAVHPKLQMLFEGALGIELDALVTLLGVAPLFVAGNGGEIACAFLGAVVVLIAGAIWRRRSPHLVAQQRAN